MPCGNWVISRYGNGKDINLLGTMMFETTYAPRCSTFSKAISAVFLFTLVLLLCAGPSLAGGGGGSERKKGFDGPSQQISVEGLSYNELKAALKAEKKTIKSLKKDLEADLKEGKDLEGQQAEAEKEIKSLKSNLANASSGVEKSAIRTELGKAKSKHKKVKRAIRTNKTNLREHYSDLTGAQNREATLTKAIQDY